LIDETDLVNIYQFTFTISQVTFGALVVANNKKKFECFIEIEPKTNPMSNQDELETSSLMVMPQPSSAAEVLETDYGNLKIEGKLLMSKSIYRNS
jgi:hypothetical protein